MIDESNIDKNMQKTRTEHDSLGEVVVPHDALYGAQTQRAVENFPVSGLAMPKSFIKALGLVKYACATVNKDLGKITAAKADAIVMAALAVANGTYDQHFPVDVFQTGSGTSTNMNANEVIANVASKALGARVHPNDDVNMGQSSNDVIPTCMHLSAAMTLSENLMPALRSLKESIQQQAELYKEVVKTGRTHLMDAMPITLSQEMSAWDKQIATNLERLSDCQFRLIRLAIGGTAVGTGTNTHKDFGSKVAAVLSSKCAPYSYTQSDNLFSALSSQETAVELSGHLKTTAVSLMKISNDLRWMNSGPLAGLGEIVLPQLQPGSSIMPGKVNPVIPEAVAQVCAQVIGNDATVTIAGQSGNFQLNVMLPVMAYNILQSIELLASGCRLLADKAIRNFEVNLENIEKALASNPILVTALNEKIGYEQSAKIAKRAYEEQRPILDVAREMTNLDEQTLAELLDPQNLC